MGNRLWVLGTVLVCVAVLALGWVLGVSPKLTEGDAAVLERQNVDLQNQAQEALLVQLKDQFERLDELEDELEELQFAVPPTHELGAYFDLIASHAASSGVALQNTTASEATVYGGTASDPAAPVDAEASSDPEVAPDGGTATLGPQPDPNLANQLFTIGISITVKGSPDQVFAFVQSIQEDDRLTLITNVSYTLDADQSDGEANVSSATGPTATISGFVFVVRE